MQDSTERAAAQYSSNALMESAISDGWFYGESKSETGWRPRKRSPARGKQTLERELPGELDNSLIER